MRRSSGPVLLPARNLKRKTVDELRQLREAGLAMLYVGAESGERGAERVNKVKPMQHEEAAGKAGEAGLQRS